MTKGDLNCSKMPSDAPNSQLRATTTTTTHYYNNTAPGPASITALPSQKASPHPRLAGIRLHNFFTCSRTSTRGLEQLYAGDLNKNGHESPIVYS